MGDADVFRENAHLAVPGFELFGLEKAKRVRGRHLCDLAVDEMGFVVVPEPERVLGRFLCLGGVTVAIAEDGRPHRLALGESGRFRMVTVADGGINVVVTDRRIVGVVQEGDSLWGPVAFQRALLWSLDLRDIDDVTMEVKSGLLGTKEKPVIIGSHLPMAGISLDVFAIPEVGGGGRKTKSSRQLMEVLVAAAASAQMASLAAGSPRSVALEKLRSGQWEWDAAEKEFVADFTGDDVCLDGHGGRADRPHWPEAENSPAVQPPPPGPQPSTSDSWWG